MQAVPPSGEEPQERFGFAHIRRLAEYPAFAACDLIGAEHEPAFSGNGERLGARQRSKRSRRRRRRQAAIRSPVRRHPPESIRKGRPNAAAPADDRRFSRRESAAPIRARKVDVDLAVTSTALPRKPKSGDKTRPKNAPFRLAGIDRPNAQQEKPCRTDSRRRTGTEGIHRPSTITLRRENRYVHDSIRCLNFSRTPSLTESFAARLWATG